MDSDGWRVIATNNGQTTLFIGGQYEVNTTTGEITKYYMAAASRIAVRKYTMPAPSTLEYLLGDHLGSTSITTSDTGTKISEMRYTPWGEVRSSSTSSSSLADYTFTGQYSYMDDPSTGATEGFGLMFYNARWYDPHLGRFAQADSIVPAGVQGYDRYAYVNNNPVNATDPSGHKCVGEPEECLEKGKPINGAGMPNTNSGGESTFDFLNNGDSIVAMINNEAVEFIYLIDSNGNTILWNTNEGVAYEGNSTLSYLDENVSDMAFYALMVDGTYDLVGIKGFSGDNGIQTIPYPYQSSYYVQAGMQQGARDPGSNLPPGYDNGYLFYNKDYDGYGALKIAFGLATSVTPYSFPISPIAIYFGVEDSYQMLWYGWEVDSVTFSPGLNSVHDYP